MAGRRSFLNETTQQRIIEGVTLGGLLPDIASHGGVSERSIQRWLERGRRYRDVLEADGLPNDADQPYYDFTTQYEDAVASVRLRMSGKILKAADGDDVTGKEPDWKAAAWFLERTAPALWGRKNVPDEVIARDEQVNIEQMTREAVAIVEQVRKRREEKTST